MRVLCLLAGIAASASAVAIVPQNSGCRTKTVQYKDTFDNAVPPVGVEPTLSAINGTAGGALFYRAFNYLNTLEPVSLTPPPSPPNVAGTSVVTQQLRGQPAFYPLSSSTTPQFQLQYLCLLCFTDTGVGTNVPVSCTVQFAGVNQRNDTSVQEVTFTPAMLPTDTRYSCATFPPDRFAGLVRVDAELVQSSEPETTVVWAMDNVTYAADVKTC